MIFNWLNLYIWCFDLSLVIAMPVLEIKVDMPKESNVIIGTSHFIKTVEDLYEAMVNSVPNIKFGIAFCESSGPCLVRREGNDSELVEAATKNALNIGAGHMFIFSLGMRIQSTFFMQ